MIHSDKHVTALDALYDAMNRPALRSPGHLVSAVETGSSSGVQLGRPFVHFTDHRLQIVVAGDGIQHRSDSVYGNEIAHTRAAGTCIRDAHLSNQHTPDRFPACGRSQAGSSHLMSNVKPHGPRR
jgi:hypothetical protein